MTGICLDEVVTIDKAAPWLSPREVRVACLSKEGLRGIAAAQRSSWRGGSTFSREQQVGFSSQSCVPIAPPRVDSSKGPTKGNRVLFLLILGFVQSMKKWSEIAPNGARSFFSTNPCTTDLLGRTDLKLEKFYILDLLDLKFPDFQIPRSPNSQISRS